MTIIYIGFMFTREMTGTNVMCVAKYDYLTDSERIQSDLEMNVNKLGPGWHGFAVEISKDIFESYSLEGMLL